MQICWRFFWKKKSKDILDPIFLCKKIRWFRIRAQIWLKLLIWPVFDDFPFLYFLPFFDFLYFSLFGVLCWVIHKQLSQQGSQHQWTINETSMSEQTLPQKRKAHPRSVNFFQNVEPSNLEHIWKNIRKYKVVLSSSLFVSKDRCIRKCSKNDANNH